jgi:hypothetical protein
MLSRNQILALLFAASCVGSAAIVVSSPGCGAGQLTVEEAEAGLSASCVLLARAMTVDHPEALDTALDRVCEPGRTRSFLARVIAEQLSREITTEDPFGSSGWAPSPTGPRTPDPGLRSKDAGH